MDALRALSEPRHACVGCGGCCHGVRVRLLGEEELTRITTLARALGVNDPVECGRVRMVDGRCIFLARDGRCELHRRFGAAAKPLLCQQFPIVLLDTESDARLGVDPGCFTLFDHWREGDLLPANARLVPTAAVLGPDQASWERRLLRWTARDDVTVGGVLRLIVGLPEDADPPPCLARRWVARLRAVRPLCALLPSEAGAPVRDTLVPVLEDLAQLEPEQLDQLPRLGPEEDAFALEVTRRTLFLRLISSLPVVPAVALLNLLGAVTLGWSGRTGRAFGRGMVAWNRAIRVPSVWSALLPTADAFHELAGTRPEG